LRAYAQKDPLVEYKQEAFQMFQEMNFLIKADTMEKLFKIQLVMNAPPPFSDDSAPDEEDGEEEEDAQDASGVEAGAEVTEQLDALKPKPQRQRLVFSSGGSSDSDAGAGGGASRSERRRLERDKKKNR
jgi:preprotein translocase subunit SecA